jgi:hypothetical protein
MWNTKRRFVPAKLCIDGTVEWNGKKVGVWSKDDFDGYHFTPSDAGEAKVWAKAKEDFRSAVSANNNQYWTKNANP